MQSSYSKRFVANIVIEATTPLKVGSSDIDMLQDAPVQKDWNELPMILGTSIAGVLRKTFEESVANDIFGDEHSKQKDNRGSRLIVSNALLCDKDMKVIETLRLNKSDFLKSFDILPVREHTAITNKGVAEKNSKFDEEVVYKGSRFKFRMELIANDKDEQNWHEILKVLNTKTFRLGSGSTKGFGDIKVLNEESSYGIYYIESEDYGQKNASLNTTYDQPFSEDAKEIEHTIYTLKITPDDFFMFGSGFGDDDADMTPVYEKVVDYDKGALSQEQILIPASSIKGALAHRTTYHYNLQNNYFIGDEKVKEGIKEIFGQAKQSDDASGCKGSILFSDCYKPKALTKVFDHVAIDRFTGGGIDGKLFQEKTITDDREYEIEILLEKEIDEKYVKAFEAALTDVTIGMLPLGGATTKGHGTFSGEWNKI